MTTIAVVRKGGVAAIAADTLTKWGSGKESAEYVVNHEKILKVGTSYVAITGSATFKIILRDYFSQPGVESNMSSSLDIFRTWNKLHSVLKERYFLMAEEDKEDSLESSRMDVLVANPHGIFGVAAHRTVQEFSRFYSYGSGSDYALGALYACYDRPGWDAKRIARYAIQAAAEFDDGTGEPVQVHAARLKGGR
jgi:ATP-dependent protease HslVU (ClpYQ) peptidase subunit